MFRGLGVIATAHWQQRTIGPSVMVVSLVIAVEHKSRKASSVGKRHNGLAGSMPQFLDVDWKHHVAVGQGKGLVRGRVVAPRRGART